MKNRTHWKEEVQKDTLTLDWKFTLEGKKLIRLGGKLNLVEGQHYIGEIYFNDIVEKRFSAIAEKDPIVGGIQLSTDEFSLIDGVDYEDDNDDSNTTVLFPSDNAVYGIRNGYTKVKIFNIPHTEIISYKIPNQYINQKEIDYYFAIEQLNKNIPNTNTSYFSTTVSYPDDTSMDIAIQLFCGEKADNKEAIPYFGLPVETSYNASVITDIFKNWESFSNLSIYCEHTLGARFIPIDKIGQILMSNDYCLSQQTVVSPLSRLLSTKTCFGLFYLLKLTFSTKDIRDAVVNNLLAPTLENAKYYRVTYKKPNPQPEFGG